MFKPEAYVDSVLDLLDDEQTLVAENIIKNPLDMQERYMSLVPDDLLDFIVKQWRPGMTSDQADKIFRKYSSFNQGGSVDFKVIGTPGGKVKPGIKYYGDNIVTPIKQGEHAGEYHLRLGGGDREVFYGSKDELEKVLSDYKLKVRQRTDIDVDLVKKLIEDANKGDKFKSPIDISDEYNKIKKTNIRLSGKTKDSPVYDILSTLESQDEKINKVFDSLLTSDQPVNFSFYEALPKDRRGETVANPWRSEIAGRTGIEQAKIKRVLNKNKDYLTNKNFFDYISKSKLGISELKDLPLNFQIEYAKEAVKGRPRFTGLDGQTNLTRDPNYKIMEFARRSWDNTKGKGQIKFFDKNGKPIEWKYGTTLPYKDVSFSYKGKNFGLNDLKQPGFSKKFFPEVVAKQEAINNLLVEEVYNPIRKKTTSFKQLANDVQVKGYKWKKGAGVIDILHDPNLGVAESPFENLRYNSRDINLLENGLYSSFKAGKLSEADYKSSLNNLNKVFNKASPEEVNTLIKNRINIQAGKIVDNDFYDFDEFRKKIRGSIEKIGCTDLAAGGRVGFETGANCFLKGVEKINSGKIAKGAEARNFVKFANQAYKLGRNVLKFGVIPEMLWIGGETLIRMGMGEGLNESFKYATSFLPGGTARAKEADLSSLTKRVGLQNAKTIMNVRGANESREKLNDLYNSLETDLAFAGGDWQAQADIEKRYEKRIKDAEKEYNIKSDFGKLDDISSGANIAARRLEDEAEDIKKSKSLFTQMKNWADEIRPDTVEGDIETVSPSESDLDIGKTKTVPLFTMEDIAKNLIFDQYAEDPKEKLKILQGMRKEDVNPGETDLERILFEQQQGGIPTVNEFVWRDIFSKAAENPAYAEQLYGASGMMGEPIQNSIIRANQAFPKTYGTFASGGIASLTTTIPPKRGPNHQGLASLKKYGKQY
jgi:hypothetical protein